VTPVRPLSVLAQPLAVVAHDGNHGPIEQCVSVEEIDDTRDLRVDERDFGVVGMPRVLRVELRRRLVWRVRIVEVQPGEEPLILHLLEPRERLVHDLVARPLHVANAEAGQLRQFEVVNEGLESLGNPPAAIEHIRRYHRAGPEAFLLQDRGKRQLLGAEKEAAVVAHSVLGRELAREDAAMRRQRQRRGCHRLLEEHPFAGEAVDCRCIDVPVPVRPDPVCARRV
jgi:hypothetical protein